MKLAILVVGYNRLDGIKRLISSIEKVEYYGDNIDIIISLDYSGNEELVEFANKYNWRFGKKIVRSFDERQGLKKHILSCGVFLNEYDAIAVFEDDLIVSPSFYKFMKESVNFYKDDMNIAGISLYSHSYNVNAKLPFVPYKTESDVFFLQFAQSWGQIWLKKQFIDFLNWIEKTKIEYKKNVPGFVRSWPDSTSWLKLHVKYCIDNNKFFVYPYESFTTCYSDIGEHVLRKQNLQQVQIVQYISSRKYVFDKLTSDSVKYDAFFERIFDNEKELLVDIYGEKKEQYCDYKRILSPLKLNNKIIESYALELKPHESNYLNKVKGNDLFLYDMNVYSRNKLHDFHQLTQFEYYYQVQNRFKTIPGILIKKIIRNILKK